MVAPISDVSSLMTCSHAFVSHQKSRIETIVADLANSLLSTPLSVRASLLIEPPPLGTSLLSNRPPIRTHPVPVRNKAFHLMRCVRWLTDITLLQSLMNGYDKSSKRGTLFFSKDLYRVFCDFLMNERPFSSIRDTTIALEPRLGCGAFSLTPADTLCFTETLTSSANHLLEAFFTGQGFLSNEDVAPFFQSTHQILEKWSPETKDINKLLRLSHEFHVLGNLIQYFHTKNDHPAYAAFKVQLLGSESDGVEGFVGGFNFYSEKVKLFILITQFLLQIESFQSSLMCAGEDALKRLTIMKQISDWLKGEEFPLSAVLNVTIADESDLGSSALTTFKDQYNHLIQQFILTMGEESAPLFAQLYDDMTNAFTAFSSIDSINSPCFIGKQASRQSRFRLWQIVFEHYAAIKNPIDERAVAYAYYLPHMNIFARAYNLLERLILWYRNPVLENASLRDILQEFAHVNKGLIKTDVGPWHISKDRLLMQMAECEKIVKNSLIMQWKDRVTALEAESLALLAAPVHDAEWQKSMMQAIMRTYTLEDLGSVLMQTENPLYLELKRMLYKLLEYWQITELEKWRGEPLKSIHITSMNGCLAFYQKVHMWWKEKENKPEEIDAEVISFQKRFQERLREILACIFSSFHSLKADIKSYYLDTNEVKKTDEFAGKIAFLEEVESRLSFWGYFFSSEEDYFNLLRRLRNMKSLNVLSSSTAELKSLNLGPKIPFCEIKKYLVKAHEQRRLLTASGIAADVKEDLNQAFGSHGECIQEALRKYIIAVLMPLGLYRSDDCALTLPALLIKSLERFNIRMQGLPLLFGHKKSHEYRHNLIKIWQEWQQSLGGCLSEEFPFSDVKLVYEKINETMLSLKV